MKNLSLFFLLNVLLSGCAPKGYLRTLDDFKPMIVKHLGEPSVIDSIQYNDYLSIFYIFQDNPKITFEKVNRFLTNGTLDASYTWVESRRHTRGGLWPLADEKSEDFDPKQGLYIIQFGKFRKIDGHTEVYISTLDFTKSKPNEGL